MDYGNITLKLWYRTAMTPEQKQTVFGIILLGILSLTGYFFRGQIEAFLRTNHLFPEPEPLSELYFEDHINLPKNFQPGVPQTLRFTIHNIEYKPMKYTVDVSARIGDKLTPIQSGTVLLAHNAFETLKQDVTLTEATRTAVLISLDSGQKIQVWMDPQLK